MRKCKDCGWEGEDFSFDEFLSVNGIKLCSKCKKIAQKRIENIVVDGQDIKDCHTLGSMYDQDSVEVRVGKIYLYRIKAEELEKLFKFFDFEERKSRKYIYLENPKLKD